MTRYLSAKNRMTDDFERKFTHLEGEVVYDARTRQGPWACMTEESYQEHGRRPLALGTGLGQKYVRNKVGELVKVEG